uniref:Protein ENM78_04595 n=1 Tax=Fervidicoccus fontis TaxID=683846 RepID=A0A7J3ZMP5_9CREN
MEEAPIRPEELTLEDGEYLVKLARSAVEKALTREKLRLDRKKREKLRRKGAAFVTIEKLLETGAKVLRGCIGYVEPVGPLVEVVANAALASAFDDPRFPPLRLSELPFVIFEVTVLSEKRLLAGSPLERPKNVVIGRMGLIARRGPFSGLLLPQVAVEYGWDEETFLSQTCIKADLEPECWKSSDVEIFYFTGRIFAEKLPGGEVVEVELEAR